MTTAELAEKASKILRIDLVCVGRRYAYRADETDEWYWVSRADMQYAITLSEDDDAEIQRSLYSHWCASTGQRVADRTTRKLDNAVQ